MVERHVIGFDRILGEVTADLVEGISTLLGGMHGSGRTFLLGELQDRLRRLGHEARIVTPHAAQAASQTIGAADRDGHAEIWLLDDVHLLPPAVLDEVYRRVETGTVTALLAVETRLDGTLTPAAARAIGRGDAVLDRVAARRHDIRPLTIAETHELLAAAPGVAELSLGVRALIAANAAGLRRTIRELAGAAAEQRGREQYRIAQHGTPAAIATMRRAMACCSDAELFALGLLDSLPGLRRETLSGLIPPAVLDRLVESRLAQHVGVSMRVVANPIAVAAALPRVDPLAVHTRLDDWLAGAMAADLHREDGALAAAIADRAFQDEATAARLRALAPETRHALLLLAARRCNDRQRSNRALAVLGLDPGLAQTPGFAVERFRALLGHARPEAAAAAIEGIDVDATDPATLRWLLQNAALAVNWAPAVVPAVERVAAAAARQGLDAEGELELIRLVRLAADDDWQAIVDTMDLERIRRADRTARTRALETAAMAQALTGRFDAAQELLLEAARHTINPVTGDPHSPRSELSLLLAGACVACLGGLEPPASGPRLRAALELAAGAQDVDTLVLATQARGIVAHAAADWARAARDLQGAADAGRRSWWMLWWMPQTICAHVDALLRSGAVEEADDLVRRAMSTVAPIARRYWHAAVVAAADVASARGDDAAAAARQRELLGGPRRVPPVLEHRIQLRIWDRSGDARARDRVLELAERLRYPLGDAFAATVRGRESDPDAVPSPAVAAVLGRPVAALSPLAERLSEREREIAQLVGLGLTNRAIAERLYLSVRTVESHIYQARSKLGLASRRDLGRLAS